MSAHTGQGLPQLLGAICKALSSRVRHITVLLPYGQLSLADVLRRFGSVQTEEYRDEGVYFKATVEVAKAHLFEEYLCPESPR